MIATGRLATRKARAADPARESKVLGELQPGLAADPAGFFQRLVNAARELSQADATGISLLDERAGRLVWPAVAGPCHAYLGEGAPGDFGPCGAVLERNATQLMLHPERHYADLQPVGQEMAELLLVPFQVGGKAIGTIWAVIHEAGRHFDAEDQRLLESLSAAASAAYRTLAQNGHLEALLRHRARHQCLIYSGTPAAQLPGIAHTLIQNLAANHRCLCLNSPAMHADLRAQLAAAGIDPGAEIERGALILTSDRAQLIDGKFNVTRMLQLLHDAVKQAVADGYAGLWATGDMTWEFDGRIEVDTLLEYERRLEEYMQRTPGFSAVCQYHRDTLPGNAIDAALSTHPFEYMSATRSRLNPTYAAPAAAPA